MSFFEFLADLTVVDWALLLVAWVIIAFALGAFTGLGIKRADKEALRQRADITRRAAYPPPVPKPDCRWCAAFDADATWLADQPTEIWLTDELCDRLFADLIAIEGLQ